MGYGGGYNLGPTAATRGGIPAPVGSSEERGADLLALLKALAYPATIPSRVGEFVDRSVQAGGFQNMPPNEVGRMVLEAGSFPLLGAVGGIPRNAAGMIADVPATAKESIAGATVAGAGMGAGAGGGYSAYSSWDDPNFSWYDVANDAGVGAGVGGLLGLSVGGAGAISNAVARRKEQAMDAQRQAFVREWREKYGKDANRAQNLAGPTPRGNTQEFPPAPPGQGPASSPQAGVQSAGSPVQPATPQSLPDGYSGSHTRVARQYLQGVMGNDLATVTPASITDDLARIFQENGLEVPKSLRHRAANTMEVLGQNSHLAISPDWMDRRRAVMRATGGAGLLGVPLAVGAQNSTDEGVLY